MDIPVGQVKQGALLAQVSSRLRPDVVVVTFTKNGRGFDVTFSPSCARDLGAMLIRGADMSEGVT